MIASERLPDGEHECYTITFGWESLLPSHKASGSLGLQAPLCQLSVQLYMPYPESISTLLTF